MAALNRAVIRMVVFMVLIVFGKLQRVLVVGCLGCRVMKKYSIVRYETWYLYFQASILFRFCNLGL